MLYFCFSSSGGFTFLKLRNNAISYATFSTPPITKGADKLIEWMRIPTNEGLIAWVTFLEIFVRPAAELLLLQQLQYRIVLWVHPFEIKPFLTDKVLQLLEGLEQMQHL